LDTLKEEPDLASIGVDTYENFTELTDEHETHINEDIIKNLVEQAKNEGIVPNADKKIDERMKYLNYG
jgi:hypothetical protein